jgi:hypothetical protein
MPSLAQNLVDQIKKSGPTEWVEPSICNAENPEWHMSGWGQKRTYPASEAMSALPLKRTFKPTSRYVRRKKDDAPFRLRASLM